MTNFGELLEKLHGIDGVPMCEIPEICGRAAKYIEWLEATYIHEPAGELPREEGDRANG